MLTEQDYELLTAYVDGELSGRQRKSVLRLLRHSREARRFLRKIQTDSQLLQGLPRQRPQPEFAAQVMRAVSDSPTPQPEPATLAANAAPVPSWPGFALAAAVLLSVTLGSYLFFAGDRPGDPPIAQNGQNPGEPKKTAPSEPTGVKLAFADIKQDAGRKALSAELKKNTAFHLHLTAKNTTEAVERLRQALTESRIEVVIDPHAQMKIEQKEKARFVIYLENVQPYEATDVFQHLAAESESLEHLYLNPLSDEHRGEVAKVLGLQPASLAAPAKLPPDAKDPMASPLPAPIQRPKKGKTPPKGSPEPARLAVVLALDTEADLKPSDSSAVMRFRDARTPLRPGSLQFVFVIQEAPTRQRTT